MSYENKGVIAPKYIVSSYGDGNYNTNGTSDETEINQAINDLTNGRDFVEMVWLKGDFTIDDPIQVPSYTHLKWTGKIALANDSNCNMVENANPSTHDNMIILEGGTLNGNKGNQATAGHGIKLECSTDHDERMYGMWVRNVKCENMYNSGMKVDFNGSPTSWIDIEGFETRFPNDYGLELHNVADAVINRSIPLGGGTHSLYAQYGGYIVMTNIYFPAGMKLDKVRTFILSNFFSDHSTQHNIELLGVRHCNFSNGNIRIFGNGIVNKDGIRMTSSGGVHCTDNMFSNLNIGRQVGAGTSRWDKGIHEVDTNQDWNIYGVINGRDCITAAIDIKGANSTYEPNLVLGGVI